MNIDQMYIEPFRPGWRLPGMPGRRRERFPNLSRFQRKVKVPDGE